MTPYLLGIDVGTTGTKAMLFTDHGTAIAHAYRGYETAAGEGGRREQNAADWWQAVVETTREVCRHVDPAAVAAISLSTQGGTIVPTDRAFRPLRPAIVWSDTRCQAEHEDFLREIGDANLLYESTGWKLVYGLPLLQLRWLKKNEPDIFARADFFLSVADFIAAKMTGIPAVDLSNAGINELTDIKNACYDPRLLGFLGITEEKLPKLIRSAEAIGPLTEAAAEALGLTTKTVLVAGAHDQYAVAAGANLTEAGDVLIGSGTSWAITAISDRPHFDAELRVSIPTVPGRFGALTSLSSGGLCLEWLRKQVISPDGEQLLSFADMDRACESAKAAETGLYFFPFEGKLTEGKEDDPSSDRGVFAGLSLSHDRYDMARAVMEGVAFQAAWLLDTYFDLHSVNRLILAGGAAKSPFWSQLLADIVGKPLVLPHLSDLACVGAAILAGVGIGRYATVEEGYRSMGIPETVLLPDPERASRYQSAFAAYRRKAAALSDFFQRG